MYAQLRIEFESKTKPNFVLFTECNNYFFILSMSAINNVHILSYFY